MFGVPRLRGIRQRSAAENRLKAGLQTFQNHVLFMLTCLSIFKCLIGYLLKNSE